VLADINHRASPVFNQQVQYLAIKFIDFHPS
jgi:hypothetical protein